MNHFTRNVYCECNILSVFMRICEEYDWIGYVSRFVENWDLSSLNDTKLSYLFSHICYHENKSERLEFHFSALEWISILAKLLEGFIQPFRTHYTCFFKTSMLVVDQSMNWNRFIFFIKTEFFDRSLPTRIMKIRYSTHEIPFQNPCKCPLWPGMVTGHIL